MKALRPAGLLANQASIDKKFVHTMQKMGGLGLRLQALFSPQHGFFGHTQANMIEVQSGWHANGKLPVYSLYGNVRKPTPEMLKGLEVVVIDLQDVGVRGYTFIWTLLYMMEACAEAGLQVIIIDRPNPISGAVVEGPMLQREFFSFVGLHEIPIRHGLTIGEMALLLQAERNISVIVKVKQMLRWGRKSYFHELNLPWVPPSPNIPTPETTLVYPGMELFEGTNISEGRGTTRPFEFFGAPFVDAEKLTTQLNRLKLPGIYFRPAAFQPTFDKWQGKLCQGAQIHVTDHRKVRSVLTAVAILQQLLRQHPTQVKFLNPPYEYEETLMPFDILAGSSQLREQLLADVDCKKIAAGWADGCANYWRRTKGARLY